MSTPGHRQEGGSPVPLVKRKVPNPEAAHLLQKDTCAGSERRLSAQAFAPVAAGFQHLLLFQKMPQTRD